MTSERLRQREFRRYYQPWLESSVGYNDDAPTENSRFHSDGSHFKSSKDTALIAFAQLGCLRLNVKRGIVTLMSTTHQYILAEATRTLSLISDLGTEGDNDEIWFGNASLPRSQGISEACLVASDYTAVSEDGRDTFTAPAFVINDITKHEDYSTRGFAGNGISFYCGVPLVTASGLSIGAYTLTDDKPRNGLRPNELRFMADMAKIVMSHFDVVKGEAARFRGEAMVLGLGRFVQGASSFRTSSAQRAMLRSPQPDGDSKSKPVLEKRHFKGLTITAADPIALRPVSASTQPLNSLSERDDSPTGTADAEPNGSTPRRPRPSTASNLDEQDFGIKDGTLKSLQYKPLDKNPPKTSNETFSRAANILRECASVDGVLFFDAVSTNLAKRSNTTEFRASNHRSDSDHSESRVRESTEHSPTRESDSDIHNKTDGSFTTSSVSGDSDGAGSETQTSKICPLLGYSIDIADQTSAGAQSLKELAMDERTLRKLIRQYPQGKLFFFADDGTYSSSENDKSASTSGDTTLSTISPESVNRRPHQRIKSHFATELKRLVPQAQSILWLPMWDFSKQRWSAGAFVWSKRADKMVMAQDDLVYLKTFANSIMVEVARADAASSDDTKATFIANMSHELRSPLHGVIGNCEILKDTPLDDFQSSLVAAIEQCGKTLNDTIDHVLDYAKINQLNKRSKRQKKLIANQHGTDSTKIGSPQDFESRKSSLEDDFDLAILLEETIEAICSSRLFQSQQKRRIPPRSSYRDDRTPTRPTDDDFKPVPVIFKIDKRDDWWVRSQPGAMKRIAINLVQNALKYTEKGTIQVTLEDRQPTIRSDDQYGGLDDSDSDLRVVLSVTDTGRGMSTDFVRNHAFTPFSQESSFSDGTGLGLSIVQLIVDSLGGNIQLKSKAGIGTEMRVLLTLPRSRKEDREKVTPASSNLVAQTSGKTISILRTIAQKEESSDTDARMEILEAAFASMAQAWFGMHTRKQTADRDAKGDLCIFLEAPSAEEMIRNCATDMFSSNADIIVVTSTSAERLVLVNKCADEFARRGVVLEVISHPIGPLKLAGTLSRCLARRSGDRVSERPKYMSRPSNERVVTYRRLNRSVMPYRSPQPDDDLSGLGNNRTEYSSWEQLSASVSSMATTPSIQENADPLSEYSPWSPTMKPAKQSSFVSRRPLSGKRTVSYDSSTMSQSDSSYPSLTRDDSSSTITPSASASNSEMWNVSPPRPQKRILLVDDNEINLNILKQGMKKFGLAFDTARDGLQAFETFKKAARPPTSSVSEGPSSSKPVPFTHVLMDISMPVMDGIESTRLIRQFERETLRGHKREQREHARRQSVTSIASAISPTSGALLEENYDRLERTPAATIITLSGVASEQTQKDMFAAGADMFLAKPVKFKELLKHLGG